jgi:MraZ protein
LKAGSPFRIFRRSGDLLCSKKILFLALTKTGASGTIFTSGGKWGKVMNQPSFLGQNFYSLDAKNRVAIPVKMRMGLARGEELILSRGLEGCLNLYPKSAWSNLNQKLENFPMKDKAEVRAFKRMLFASASEVEFDEEGRILIPQALVEYARLSRDVVIVGMGEKIEIWGKKIWDAYQKKRGQSFKKHASELEI